MVDSTRRFGNLLKSKRRFRNGIFAADVEEVNTCVIVKHS